MSGGFIEIVNMSFSAGCVAVIVMLIRVFLKKAPRKYSYALWAIVFFRLAYPFPIHLPVSVLPVQSQSIPRGIFYSNNQYVQAGVALARGTVDSVIDRAPVKPANSYYPRQILLMAGASLWATGVILIISRALFGFLRLKKRISTAIRVCDNVYETDLINTPFVLGFVRPRIYIPTGLGEKEFQYIVRHERTHIKRLDYLIKPAAFFITSIHWFNPLAWASYALLGKDIELSADEAVIKQSDTDIRNDYSHSLLAFSVKTNGLKGLLAFGETGVKERIKNVLHYRRPTIWATSAAVFIVATACLLLVGNRIGKASGGISTETALKGASAGAYASAADLPEPSASGPNQDAAPALKPVYKKIGVGYLSDADGIKTANHFEITDPSITDFVDTYLASLENPSQTVDLNNILTNKYQIDLTGDNGAYSCALYYDTQNDTVYIVNDGDCYELRVKSAREIDSFLQNTVITQQMVDSAVAKYKGSLIELVEGTNG